MKLLLNNWRLLVGCFWIIVGVIAYDSAYESIGILALMFGALTIVGRDKETTIVIADRLKLETSIEKEKQDESA